jgi:thiol:disulfide interchange protein DsbD
MNKILFSFLFLFNLAAQADLKVQGKHVVLELITENSDINSGKSFDVGLHFQMDPEWHVYWINPGDSGEAPRITWHLPEGYTAGPLQWPQPEKITVGPLADYGYSKEVLFISTLKTQGPSRKPVEISAEVKWLVCREVCIPGRGTVTLNIGDHSQLFKTTRQSLPQDLPTAWTVKGESRGNNFELQITSPGPIATAEFFPFSALQIDSPAHQEWDGKTLKIKKSEQLAQDPLFMDGLLLTSGQSFNVHIPMTIVTSPTFKNFLVMLIWAFFGGLLLNLMPCVFPVLSMKVFGFLKMTGAEKKKLRWHAWVYTAGILVSFWILVGALLFLKASGQKLGWGFQLQSPPFVSFLSAILFLFGLNLVGVFEISGSFTGAGNHLTRKEGLTGVFFTGVLATLVSTPCTAPFMGAAVGFALSQSALISVAIFSSLALGLAFPYILLSYIPSVGALLPKPGPWMETLKQITGFLIFATVIWLISVVVMQTSPAFIIVIMSSLFIMALAAWVLRRWPQARLLALFLIIMALILSVRTQTQGKSSLAWENYSAQTLEEYRQKGRPVFIDFTAAWCISCKVNELVVFGSQDVIQKIQERHVVLMKADWTSHDEDITKALESFGRSGVPAYVIYTSASGAPDILPEIITPGIVLSALDKIKLPKGD